VYVFFTVGWVKSRIVLILPVLPLLLFAALPALAYEDEMQIIAHYDFESVEPLSKYLAINLTDYSVLSTTPSLAKEAGFLVLNSDIDSGTASGIRLDGLTFTATGGEVLAYGWIIENAYGNLSIIDPTTKRILTLSCDGDYIAIVRGNNSLLIYYKGGKIELANFTGSEVIVFASGQAMIDALDYVVLRALQNPPSGFTLIRSGSGETVFTYSTGSANRVTVWFDETHEGGDVDLFIFKATNPYYGEASPSWGWGTLMARCDAYIFADSTPRTRTIYSPGGSLKFVVKRFSGDANAVQWRVAIQLGGGGGGGGSQQPQPIQPQPQPIQPPVTVTVTQPPTTTTVTQTVVVTQTVAQTQTQVQPIVLPMVGQVQSALQNNPTMMMLLLLAVFIVLVVVLARR